MVSSYWLVVSRYLLLLIIDYWSLDIGHRINKYTMIIVHACTTIIAHACTKIIEHVSCPKELMFGVVEDGGSGGRSPPDKQGGLGGRRPPNDGPLNNLTTE